MTEMTIRRVEVKVSFAGSPAGQYCYGPDVDAVFTEYNQRFDTLHQRLQTAEQEKAVLLRVCPNCAGPMKPEPEGNGLRGVYCVECRERDVYQDKEIDRLTAERDAALQRLQFWRSRVQFVYFSGGPDVGTDEEMFTRLCEVNDREPEALKAQLNDALQRLATMEAERDKFHAALNNIASWGEGATVNACFDEPGAAHTAREALATTDRSVTP